MGAELFDWLVRATLAISVATAGVLVARPLWRRAFGPAGVLWPWLLVPALLVAVSVPRPARVVEAPAEVVLQDVAHRSPPMPLDPTPSASTAAPGLSVRDRLRPYAAALVATWLGGAVVLALALARRQRRFRRALEPLRPRADGSYASSAIGIGPVLVGVLRPRIVVPAESHSTALPSVGDARSRQASSRRCRPPEESCSCR